MNLKKVNNAVDIKKMDMGKYYDFHITIRNVTGKELLKKLTLKLKKEKIIVNKIVFLGNLKKIKKLLPLVRGKFPFITISDSLPAKMIGKNVNLHINGIKIINGQSQQIKINGAIVGNYFDFPDFEYLNVAGICFKNKKPSFKKEANAEYTKITKILEQYKFEVKNIYRFWNYMGAIWQNYPDFNAIRDAYFRKNSITKFPAATGIEARLGFGKKVSLGFEAIKPKKEGKANWRTIKSAMQCEAFEYVQKVSGMPSGPKFSRAVHLSLSRNGVNRLYISGTSSVDKKGESSLKNDLEKNVAFTMESFIHLLEENDFSLAGIVSTYVYFKNQKTFQEFEKLYISRKWNFPYNPVFTNICRKDFFFEIEGVAANKSESHQF